MSARPSFFAELKRRHVWRVAVAYAVVAWLLLQLLSIIFPTFGAPTWVLKVVTVLLAVGFPLVLILAWAFEVTPEGVRRTEPAHVEDARLPGDARRIGRGLNTIIIVVLILAVAVTGWRLYAVKHANSNAHVAAITAEPATASSPGANAAPSAAQAVIPVPAASIPEKSVAVLPFVNESGRKDQQFFSDGLSEDLITTLSQFDGLKVISRDSAFQFRDSKDSSAEIGKLLGVAHLLEGSVQRAGDEVRITATLVDAIDGRVIWSNRYDKPYKDLFALQDAITNAVANALKAKLLTAPGAVVQSDRPPSGSLAAYAAYQHGVAYDALGTEAADRQAIAAFQQAIALDPKYAAAYVRIAFDFAGLATQYGGPHAASEVAKARAAVAKALALDPKLASAHQARASLLLKVDMDWTHAEAEVRRALQLAPNDSGAQSSLATVLATQGHDAHAVELMRKVLDRDPRGSGGWASFSIYLTALGRLDEAEQAVDKAIALQPGAAYYHEQAAVIAILRNDVKVALGAAQKEPPGPWHEIAMALALQIGPDRQAADAALKGLIAKYADGAPFQIAEVYALRHDPDAVFKWLDRAWATHDSGVTNLLFDPFILRYRDDPRFAAFCKKVGLPTTTDAVAMQ